MHWRTRVINVPTGEGSDALKAERQGKITLRTHEVEKKPALAWAGQQIVLATPHVATSPLLIYHVLLSCLPHGATMETVKLSSKGQVVIPKDIRDAQRLAAGTEFFVACVDGEIRLTPAPVFPRAKVADGRGMLARKGGKRLSDEETRRAIGRMLKERDEATKR